MRSRSLEGGGSESPDLRDRDGRPLRVVIAHDFAQVLGGAERVLGEIAATFPDAPVFSLLGSRRVASELGIDDRFHSILPPRQRLARSYRLLAPVLPLVVERTTLPEADVLVTSSYAFALGFSTTNRAPHVCYCHSPLRFAWTMTRDYRRHWSWGGASGLAFDIFAAAMRIADRRAAQRVDHFLTQSDFIAGQIKTFYGRDAEVIGAPVDCDLFRPGTNDPEDYFLLVGRLVEPYLRASVAIEAFRQLPHERLVVVGDGPAARELHAAAPPNVTFLGRVPDGALVELMQRCKALVSPTLHDFGLVPIEAMACGRPVIAYGRGGARRTVVHGRTGLLFDEQTPEAIAAAIRSFDPDRFDRDAIRRHALRWDKHRFRERLRRTVELVARSANAAQRADRRPVAGSASLAATPA